MSENRLESPLLSEQRGRSEYFTFHPDRSRDADWQVEGRDQGAEQEGEEPDVGSGQCCQWPLGIRGAFIEVLLIKLPEGLNKSIFTLGLAPLSCFSLSKFKVLFF